MQRLTGGGRLCPAPGETREQRRRSKSLVDGRRSGTWKACPLTGARRKRSWPAGTTCASGAARPVKRSVRGRALKRSWRLNEAEGSAAPVRYGAPLLPGRALKARLKLGGRRQPDFHPSRGRRKACEARESSGSAGARADGRLQKLVRCIFPASSTAPARVVETALGSTDRSLLVTVELSRFGRQGCRVTERWSEPLA